MADEADWEPRVPTAEPDVVTTAYVENDRAPDELAVFSRGERMASEWLVATGEASFVHLESVR
ncbi:hypothetical protein [Halopiger goleimassiliensis]|uniref:hypothetical protein n=1 Tax=Halopiger goleimassiliensis TaxID=1293048 RepID=UPI0006776A74|nr:hypothetical protein [Halopiger goleimassiliensis]